MKVFAVMVQLHTVTGQIVATPVGAYENEADAKKAYQEKGHILAGIADGKIVVATPNGPKAVCSVKELLLRLGVTSVSHALGGFETESPIAVAKPQILIAKN